MGLVRQVSPSLAFLHDLLLADDETSAGEVDANSSIYKFLHSICFETCLRAIHKVSMALAVLGGRGVC